MAKYTVRYPNGVERTKYTTDLTIPAKRTKGRVQHLPGARYFIKPSLGKVIIRKSGVTRTSKRVADINAQLEAQAEKDTHPARVCGGRPWDEFVACLRREMKKLIKPTT